MSSNVMTASFRPYPVLLFESLCHHIHENMSMAIVSILLKAYKIHILRLRQVPYPLHLFLARIALHLAPEPLCVLRPVNASIFVVIQQLPRWTQQMPGASGHNYEYRIRILFCNLLHLCKVCFFQHFRTSSCGLTPEKSENRTIFFPTFRAYRTQFPVPPLEPSQNAATISDRSTIRSFRR